MEVAALDGSVEGDDGAAAERGGGCVSGRVNLGCELLKLGFVLAGELPMSVATEAPVTSSSAQGNAVQELSHWIGGARIAGGSGRFADVYHPASGTVQARMVGVALAWARERSWSARATS